MGLAALIVENPPLTPAAWALGLRAVEVAGVIDVVPAARTVLVSCADAAALDAAVTRFGEVIPMSTPSDTAAITIDVVYDGADLADVASSTGLTIDELVDLHTATEYRVAFCGFAPGFGYLTGLPAVLHLPRRATPRISVPAGSVAIAAEYAAVYPRSSPGGWHLLGTTGATLFDVERDPPAVLQPGTTVRFRRVT